MVRICKLSVILGLCLFTWAPAFSQLNDSIFDALLAKAYYSDSSDHYFAIAEKQMSTSRQMGQYHYFQIFNKKNQGKRQSADLHGQQAISYFMEAQDYERWEKTIDKLWAMHLNSGSMSEAMKYCLQGIDLSIMRSDTAKHAYYLASRAIIHHDSEGYEEGVKCGKEAEAILNEFSAATGPMYLITLNSIAVNFDDWGKPDSALSHYHRILSHQDLGQGLEVARIYNNMGNTLLKKKEYARAKIWLSKAYGIERVVGNHYQLATSTTNLGTVLDRMGYTDSASYFLTLAEAFADSSGSVEKRRDIYFQLSEHERKKGNFESAISYRDRYHAVRDTLTMTERIKLMADLGTKYDTEKKEREIAHLNQQAELREIKIERNATAVIALAIGMVLLIVVFYLWRQWYMGRQRALLQEESIRMKEQQLSAVINSEEKERKRFAADLHDSIGQMVATLGMSLGRLREVNGDTAARDTIMTNSALLLQDMQREIRNTAFNLMPHVLVKDGLESAIHELCERLSNTGKVSATLQVNGLDHRMSETFEVSLYRILQEWVSNVIKYAGATEIFIQITELPDELLLTVEDDGQGFDLTLFERSKGNGWNNMNTRLELIQGEMEIDTRLDRRGTMLTVTLNPKEQPDGAKDHLVPIYTNPAYAKV